MQIKINGQRNENLPLKIVRVNATALCDTGANLSCMSYTCYMKLKDPPPLQNAATMYVHSATGHYICPIYLTCCGIMIGNLQFRHTYCT